MNHFRNNRACRSIAGFTGAALATLLTACGTETERYEYVHTEGVEQGFNMPYTPAIKINSGKTVYLSGVTAAGCDQSSSSGEPWPAQKGQVKRSLQNPRRALQTSRN